MLSNKKIALFIPAYEHTKTLPSVLDRIPKNILDIVEEIIIIDDASTDNTYLLAKGYKLDRGMDKINVYKNTKNKGYGGNQKRAYRYAIDKGYDIIAMLHGDGQYGPEQLPDLLKVFEEDENVGMVFGSRMIGNPLKGGMPFYKYIGNKFLTMVENFILGTNLTEFHSGYRIYNCHALKQVPFELCSNDFHFDTDIIVQFVKNKLKISEVPIPTYYGDEISNVKVFKYGFDVLKSVMLYRLHKSGLIKIKKFDV
jgi:glycosyltransferase involved in cell wall biosynthesis